MHESSRQAVLATTVLARDKDESTISMSERTIHPDRAIAEAAYASAALAASSRQLASPPSLGGDIYECGQPDSSVYRLCLPSDSTHTEATGLSARLRGGGSPRIEAASSRKDAMGVTRAADRHEYAHLKDLSGTPASFWSPRAIRLLYWHHVGHSAWLSLADKCWEGWNDASGAPCALSIEWQPWRALLDDVSRSAFEPRWASPTACHV